MIEFDYSQINSRPPWTILDQEQIIRKWLRRNGVEEAKVIVTVVGSTWHCDVKLDEKDAAISTLLLLSGDDVF